MYVCMYVPKKSNKHCRRIVGIRVFLGSKANPKCFALCFALRNLWLLPVSVIIIFWRFNLRSFLPTAFARIFGKMNLDGVGLVLEGNAQLLGLTKELLVGRLALWIFCSLILLQSTEAFVEITQLTWVERKLF